VSLVQVIAEVAKKALTPVILVNLSLNTQSYMEKNALRAAHQDMEAMVLMDLVVSKYKNLSSHFHS
jgi:hypothetical protein